MTARAEPLDPTERIERYARFPQFLARFQWLHPHDAETAPIPDKADSLILWPFGPGPSLSSTRRPNRPPRGRDASERRLG